MAGFSPITYALAKSMARKTMQGAGAIKGDKGDKGDAGTIEIAGVDTVEPDEAPKVENIGTKSSAKLFFFLPRGAKGEKGEKGEKGDTGHAAKVTLGTVETVDATENASIEETGTETNKIFSFKIPRGAKGEQGEKGKNGADGKSFTISGAYQTKEALEEAHPIGNPGDAYFVLNETDKTKQDLYIWLVEENKWFNQGPIAGVKGDDGEAASVQIGTVTKGDPGTEPSVHNSGTDLNAIFNFTIPQGEKGDPGKVSYIFDYSRYEDLPKKGEDGGVYCIPNPDASGDRDLYFEYAWTGSRYELLGTSSGSAVTTSDITANTAVGAISAGTKISKGTSLTDLVTKLLVKELAPSVTFTASGAGLKEVGTTATSTLTLKINDVGTSTPTKIEFFSGSTSLGTMDYVAGTSTYTLSGTQTVTTNTTFKAVLTYKKSDGTSIGTVSGQATFTFVNASYQGAVSSAPTDLTGLTKLSLSNTFKRTLTFALNNQKSCYVYPKAFGTANSIKDANNFEYLGSYDRTEITVDSVTYYVYMLKDPVTAASFKQTFA